MQLDRDRDTLRAGSSAVSRRPIFGRVSGRGSMVPSVALGSV